MILPIMLMLVADTATTVGDASDRLTACVFSKADQFSASKEGAETIVNAALAACLTERADLRTIMHKNMLQISPSLSREAEKETFDMIIGGVRDDALVRVVSAKAKNAKD